MAKKTEPESLTVPAARRDADAVLGDKPQCWSPEDLQRLDQQLTDLATVLLELKSRLDSLESRFLVTESQIAKLDLGDNLLPAEVVRDVSLGAVYQSALQASLIGMFMASPAGMIATKSIESNIRRACDAAERVLNETIRRTQLREKRA